ncbi:MAG: 6-phosphogluconolactonase [Bacteroidota bacterium]
MIKKNIYPDNRAVAEAFADFLKEEIDKVDQFHIALSGGSTPKILFALLAEKFQAAIDWKKVHLYWGDERCVPPHHPESNYGMTHEKLIQHVEIPSTNIHRVKGEDDPENEAKRYGQEIERQLNKKNNLPVFDLVILGMGSDGHTASIFPHQIELLNAATTCAVATHPQSGQQRITLTGNVINAAKQIHFLVTGASKKEVVQEIFSQNGDYKNYPASYIENAVWWLDEAAVN